MGVKSKATVFDTDYNQEPGINHKLRRRDSYVWEVDVDFLTGAKFFELGHFSGPQVGPGADGDAMGEEAHTRITYPSASGRDHENVDPAARAKGRGAGSKPGAHDGKHKKHFDRKVKG